MRARRAVAAVLAAAATQLAACGVLTPHIPEKPAATPSATATATVVPTASAPATGQVTAAARATQAQLGVQIFWHEVNETEQIKTNMDRLLDYVVGLGSNSVGITFPIYTDGGRPTRVYTRAGVTPTPAALRTVIAAGRARGLRVLVRPLIDEANLKGTTWRGSIKPPDLDRWFTSYMKILSPYLTASQAAGAESFVLGSELDSLVPHQKQWRAAVAEAKKVFTGRLVYADNWGSWATGRPGVPGADPGLDAYPQLGVTDSSTVAQITAAWSKWLRKRPADLARTTFQEIGIAAAPGAYAKPAGWPTEGQKVTPEIQIRWFLGACGAAKAQRMAGIYFWTLDAWADPANAGGYNAGSFVGRGDQAIKECFGSGWPGQ